MSFRELRAGVGRWFKANARRAIITAVVGFAVGWVINVWVMAVRYDGFRAGPSALATADGNVLNGGLFFGILSMLVVGVVSYGFGVGWSTFRTEVAAVPGAIARLVRESGGRAWSLILWNGAVLMLVSGVVAPGVSAVLGLGLLAMAPSALSQIAGRFFVRLWAEAVNLVAPAKRPKVSGLGASLIGLTGAGAGLLLASQADTTSVRVVLAAVMIGGAYLIVARPGVSAGVVIVFGGIGLVWIVAGAYPAFADDGGWLEFQFSNPDANWWDWLTHPETQPVLVAGVAGGVATGAGAAAGAAVGSVLSTLGAPSLSGATWNDPNAPGATTATPPAATTTTIILEGDDARAALDAWRNRQQGTPPVIDIPEEEQWRVWASSADGTDLVREGHIGTRGVVTGIGAVAEGDDGSIVIVVDVEGFVPPGTTPPAEIPLYPDSSDDGTAPDGSAADHDTVAAPTPESADGDGSGDGDETPSGGRSGTTPQPAAAGEEAPSPESEAAPEPAHVDAPGPTPVAGGVEGESTEEVEAEPPNDADSAADWARNTLTGKVPAETVEDIGDFLTDPQRSEVTVAPRIGGIYGSIVGQPQNTESGVRIPLKGIGHVDLEVEDGQLVVRATPGALGRTVDLLSSIFSSENSKLPSFDDVNRGAASSAARVNAAMSATGRTFTGVEALPDGSIRLTTGSG